jgi:hypothetical protein
MSPEYYYTDFIYTEISNKIIFISGAIYVRVLVGAHH